MKCPACANDLTSVKAAEITIDACLAGCGGIWFDNFELKKIDEPHEAAAALLLEIVPGTAAVVDSSQRRSCPKCSDVVMMRHFFSRRKQVEVDECPNCGGHWLDAGELARIRHEREVERAEQKLKEDYAAGIPVNKAARPRL
jgi:uncharacterized protein